MRDPGSMTEPTIAIRPPLDADRDQWAALFRAYREFYQLAPDEAVIERVWSWIGDPAHETTAPVAATGNGALIGLAHFRRFARPSTGSTGIYSTTCSPTRSIGAPGGTRADHGGHRDRRPRGMQHRPWITASDNRTAQRLYESLAIRTSWLTYDRLCRPGF